MLGDRTRGSDLARPLVEKLSRLGNVARAETGKGEPALLHEISSAKLLDPV